MADHLEPHYWAKSALGLDIYQWQKDALASVGKGFPTVVCAPNGSGKIVSHPDSDDLMVLKGASQRPLRGDIWILESAEVTGLR